MPQATVTDSAGNVRKVKNLGWLLRHWKDVDYFIVTTPAREEFPRADVKLTAVLKRLEGEYTIYWMSAAVCWDWLDRPVFRTARLVWNGEETQCGGKKPANFHGRVTQ